MDIYLQDLSPEMRVQILRAQRFLSGDPLGAMGVTNRHHERLTRLDIVTPGFLGAAIAFLADTLFSTHGWWSNPITSAGLGAAGGIAIGYGMKAQSRRRRSEAAQSRKITDQEISVLDKLENAFGKKTVRDELRQNYVELLCAVVRMPQPESTAAQSIKCTLRVLGETIEGLPALAADNLLIDPHSLTEQARILSGQADTEADFLVAASSRRQASALLRQAETITRTATLVRRNQALRAEVAAQVNTFQTSLAAGQINGYQNGGDLAKLAEHVALIAQEADALTDARLELDAALTILPVITEATLPQAVSASGK